MLKITRILNLAPKVFKANNNKVIRVNSDRANEIVVNSSNKLKNEKSKNQMCIGAIRKSIFLIFNAKKTFDNLKQAFIKALIL